jgi:hypothetical protein
MTTTAPAMSPTAERVIGLLKPLTPFAEAIVRRQAERAGLDLGALREEHVTRVGPMIVSAAKVFLDPVQLEQLKRLMA